MKKIQELFKKLVGTRWVLTLAGLAIFAYPAFLGAQIGYRYVRGSGTATTVMCWDSSFVARNCTAGEISSLGFPLTVDTLVANDGVEFRFGTLSDASIEYIVGTDTFSLRHPTGALTLSSSTLLTVSSSTADVSITSTLADVNITGTTGIDIVNGAANINIEDVPVAGSGGLINNFIAGLTAMNGSDTTDFVELNPLNANHTGTSNILNIIRITSLSGDANSNLNAISIGNLSGTVGAASEVEAAIKVGTGWDVDLLLTGSGIIDGDLFLGTNDVDDITVNGPIIFKVLREDFDFQAFTITEDDFTVGVVADTNENILILPMSQIGIIGFRHEQAFGGTSAPFTVAGQLNMSDMVDDVDTDGLDFRLGSGYTAGSGNIQMHSVLFDEDNSSSTYCEIGLTITTIANIDQFYFGWQLETEGYLDGNSITTINTGAYFRVPDTLGDLDVETELNAGGTLNDDTGVTWADAANHILRVTLLADTVTFTLDGTAVTQVNAVLNLDDGDRMVCMWGFQNSSAAADAGMNLTYVEVGVSQ